MIDRAQLVKKLNSWLDNDPSNRLRFIRVHHYVGTKVGSQVGVVQVAETDVDVHELASKLFDMVVEDARGIGDVQRYTMLPHFGDESQPSGRYNVYVQAPSVDGSDGEITSEPANDKGVATKLMRHIEVREKAFMAFVLDQQKLLMRQVEISNQRAMDADESRLRTMQLTEELLSRKHERDMELKTTEDNAKMRQLVAGQVMNLLPIVLAKMTGINPAAGQMGANMATQKVIDRLVDSLAAEPERMMLVAQNLTQDQQLMVAELIRMKTEKDQEEAKAQEQKTASSMLSILPPGAK